MTTTINPVRLILQRCHNNNDTRREGLKNRFYRLLQYLVCSSERCLFLSFYRQPGVRLLSRMLRLSILHELEYAILSGIHFWGSWKQLEKPVTLVLRQIWGCFNLIETKSLSSATIQNLPSHTLPFLYF